MVDTHRRLGSPGLYHGPDDAVARVHGPGNCQAGGPDERDIAEQYGNEVSPETLSRMQHGLKLETLAASARIGAQASISYENTLFNARQSYDSALVKLAEAGDMKGFRKAREQYSAV